MFMAPHAARCGCCCGVMEEFQDGSTRYESISRGQSSTVTFLASFGLRIVSVVVLAVTFAFLQCFERFGQRWSVTTSTFAAIFVLSTQIPSETVACHRHLPPRPARPWPCPHHHLSPCCHAPPKTTRTREEVHKESNTLLKNAAETAVDEGNFFGG
jgi:hypothetical protein